jgi:CBS domain-containing protein
VLVRDIMTTDVVTVGPRTTLREAAHLLVGHRFTALPVVDAGGGLVGIVTEADLAPLRRHDARSPKLAAEMAAAVPTCVAEVATSDLVTVFPWTDAADAVELMRSSRHRSLPVVDGARLAGIVTRSDVVRADDISDVVVAAAVRRLLNLYVGYARCASTVSDGAVTVEGLPEDTGERHVVAVLLQQIPGVTTVDVGAPTVSDGNRT